MTRPLEPPSRDTAVPVSTGPIPLSDAQIDQVSGGSSGQSFTDTVHTAVSLFIIPSDPVIPTDPYRPGSTISSGAKALKHPT